MLALAHEFADTWFPGLEVSTIKGTARSQVLVPVFIVVALLVICASNSQQATSTGPVPPVAEHERVGGSLWYPWLHRRCDQVLRDLDIEPQHRAGTELNQTEKTLGSHHRATGVLPRGLKASKLC